MGYIMFFTKFVHSESKVRPSIFLARSECWTAPYLASQFRKQNIENVILNMILLRIVLKTSMSACLNPGIGHEYQQYYVKRAKHIKEKKDVISIVVIRTD